MKVFLDGWFGQDNFGDNILFDKNLQFIQEIFPYAKIFVRFAGRIVLFEDYERMKIEPILKTMRPGKFNTFFRLMDDLKFYRSLSIYIFGGGSSYSDHSRKRMTSMFIRTIILAVVKISGGNTVALSSGFGPIRTNLGRLLSFLIVNLYDVVELREQSSFRMVKDFRLLRGICLHSSDPIVDGFYMDEPGRELVLDKSSVAFMPCFSEGDVALSRRQKTWEKVFLACIANNVKYIYYIAIGAGDDFMFSCFNELKKNVNCEISFHRCTSMCELNDCLKNCRFVIAERFHGVLFSYLKGIPTFAMCYHGKVGQMVSELDISHMKICYDWEQNKIDDVISATSARSFRFCFGEDKVAFLAERYRRCRLVIRSWLFNLSAEFRGGEV